ncbi:MAG: hypothetical protein Q8O40_15885 [Chloroflexota bacterium]|nr:hypothetical protein [Chloroflexota bacterium]
MTRLLRREKGVAMVTVLALMALAVPLVVAALGLASTLSKDSAVKTEILKSQYAAIAGSQHAFYRLVYDTNYLSGLEVGVPASYQITVNGQTVTVNMLKLSNPQLIPPPPNADGSRRIQAAKTVTPVTAAPNTLTTFTYTIVIENRDNEAENLTKIYDGLPAGFSYVAGSTSGVTAQNPSISGRTLTWNLSPLHLSLQPGQSVTLMFDATASVAEGNYCNKAWADPGGDKTSSGPTAKVRVGSPATELCGGEAITLTKTVDPAIAAAGTPTTFTYTIAIQNTGTSTLNMSKIRDLLPPGLFYVSGSTTGDITTANPNTTMFQGSQRLDWDFSPKHQIPAGATRTLSFQATATAAPGKYWNEVWVTVDEFAYSIYSWPTAVVQAMGVFESSASDGQSTASSEVWVGSDTYAVASWEITR